MTKGADGEHVDCYIGENPKASKAYVIHQLKSNGKFDEDKVMLGYNDAMSAKRAYLAHVPSKMFDSMSIMSMDAFKKKVLARTGKKLKAMHDFRDSPVFDSVGKFHSPSNLKSGKSYVPTDDPGETDNKYMDVERRNSKETQKERQRLMNTKPSPVHINKTQQTPNFDDPSPIGTRGTFGVVMGGGPGSGRHKVGDRVQRNPSNNPKWKAQYGQDHTKGIVVKVEKGTDDKGRATMIYHVLTDKQKAHNSDFHRNPHKYDPIWDAPKTGGIPYTEKELITLKD